MALSFADHYGIPDEVYDATGALNPILDVDTRMFIDPAFLRITTTPEFKNSYQDVLTYFDDVLRVVANINEVGDVFWKTADKRITFPEVQGLCIGYSAKSTGGSGMGRKLRAKLLQTILDVIRAGVQDPKVFELVGVFEEDIGPDRISDMIAKIIIEDLIAYTKRICNSLGIPLETLPYSKGHVTELPLNPITEKPVILVPKELLNDLPVVEAYSDLQWVANRNDAIREELNRIIGTSWSHISSSRRKEIIKNTCISHPDILREILDAYAASNPQFYDFLADRSGEVVWYNAAKEVVQNHQLSLTLPEKPTPQQVFDVVLEICEVYRHLIEDCQLSTLLYYEGDDGERRKRESAAQKVFHGIAYCYCKANNLDLTPEANAGRGPVDFKVSRGFDAKVIVELKLTSNKDLVHGFTKQVEAYQEAEGTIYSIYLVVDNGGATEARLEKFMQTVRETAQPAPRLMMVDARRKPSASVA